MKITKCLIGFVFCAYWCSITGGRADNLVVNGDFSQGNTAFSNEYVYIPAGYSYQPQTYAIRSSTTNFNPLLDHFLDHTTGDGLMMIVDGGFAQEVVWQQTVPVQTNTNYRFAGWYVATHLSKAACIQYKVNGVAIGNPYYIPDGSGVWNEYAVSWASGSATSAVIQVVDLQTDNSTAGNDFAVDDISFADTGAATPSAIGIGTYAGVEIRGSIGATYRVEWRHDMGQNENWTHIATVVLSSSPYIIYHRESNGKERGFYRVLQQ